MRISIKEIFALLISAIFFSPCHAADRKARVVVVNTNQSLADQLCLENVTYVIRHQIEIREDVFLPKGCILEFARGKIISSNNHVRLIGNNVVRNGKFVNTGIIIDGENAIIENNTFRVTLKNNIGYGVIGSDAYGGKIVIRKNKIINKTQFGAITLSLPARSKHAEVIIEKNEIIYSNIGITINARPRKLGIDKVLISDNSIRLYKPSRLARATKELWGMGVTLEKDIDFAEVKGNYIEGCIGLELAGVNNTNVNNNTIKVVGTDTYSKRAFGIYQSDEVLYKNGKINILNNDIEVKKVMWEQGGDVGTIYISFAQNQNFTINGNTLKGGGIKFVQAKNSIKDNMNMITIINNHIETGLECPLVLDLQERGEDILYNIMVENNIIHSKTAGTFIRCNNTNYTGKSNVFFQKGNVVNTPINRLSLSKTSKGVE